MSAAGEPSNFGSVSDKLPGVYGVASPGEPDPASMEEGSIGNDVVNEWAAALKGDHGITRTLCLLNADELMCYAEPGYTELLKAQGMTPSLVNLQSDKAWERANMSLLAAEAGGEKSAPRSRCRLCLL